MLLCGYTCQWLEPVAVMCCTLLDRPFLHLVSNHIGYFRRKFLAFLNGFLQFLVNLLRESLFHNRVIEYIASKNFCYIHII